MENTINIRYNHKWHAEASVAERSNARDCKSRAQWATQVRILPDALRKSRPCMNHDRQERINAAGLPRQNAAGFG